MAIKRLKSGDRVITGRINTGTYNGQENKIHLFDGKFTTGYRVVDFQIASDLPLGADDLAGLLSTEPKSTLGQWNWADVEEIAWSVRSGNGTTTSTIFDRYENIRADNMVIRDLYLQAYTSGEATLMNYMITLEKYEFAAWDGASILVQNESQSG